MVRHILLALMLAAGARPGSAQSTAPKSEYAFIVIAGYECPCNASGIDEAVVEMYRNAVAGEASGDHDLRLIGVAIGAPAQESAKYLLQGVSAEGDTLAFPVWHEIHAGGGWLNDLVLNRLVRDRNATLIYPQMIVLERQIATNPDRFIVDERVVDRVVGTDAIRAFRLPGH